MRLFKATNTHYAAGPLWISPMQNDLTRLKTSGRCEWLGKGLKISALLNTELPRALWHSAITGFQGDLNACPVF